VTNHCPVIVTGLPDETYSIYNKPDRISILIYAPGLRPPVHLQPKAHKTRGIGPPDIGGIIAQFSIKKSPPCRVNEMIKPK